MLRKIDQTRIDRLRELISRMIKADYNNRVARTEEDDALESLLIEINWMSEELKETLQTYQIHHSIEPRSRYTGMVLLLDTHFKVLYANKEVTQQLDIPNESLLDSSFDSFLSKNSLDIWRVLSKDLLVHLNFETLQELRFLTSTGLEKSYVCAITAFKHSLFAHHLILVTTCTTCLKRTLLELRSSNRKPLQSLQSNGAPFQPLLMHPRDVKLLQSVRAYLLKHLDEPLPTQRELASLFGTNETKLKKGFKAIYAITISQFVAAERLKRAKLLLESVDMTFKQIAYAVGFKSYPSFSRAFKRVYGMSPMAYRNRHQSPL